ncbi:serine decarboxylase-like [Andrographis paniculata]|uniref:serine decarboxylase-like n=1 Tax=Andrographis paniculata TaxID=175694 RepID=UPI0021E85D1F|nr:serine decarboxylase-like [Andrographis paniculata]
MLSSLANGGTKDHKENKKKMDLNGGQDHNDKNMIESFTVGEPCDNVNAADPSSSRLSKIIAKFQEHLAESINHSLGFPGNLDCSRYIALSPLLGFHLNNVGDPFIKSNFALNSKMFEVEVLEWFARLWAIGKNEYWGYVTNGGTEGNLKGLLLGRELLSDGILYTSKASHYSILKIARMYRMKCEIVDTLTTGEINCNDLREKLLLNKHKPAIVNATIGTTFKGGIDNINLIISTLYECGFSDDRFYIHCDAALFGLILPLIEQESNLSFKRRIGSISVSGHKLLGSPMPCGVFMTRNKNRNLLAQNIEYIASLDTTISGSRNGHATILMWYGLNIKGIMGLKEDVEMCLENARYLRDELRNCGITAMVNENSNIVVLERPLDDGFANYWQLSCTQKMAHVVVMPHITTNMLDQFVEDLVEKRRTWYGRFDDLRPPCLAAEIGISNCSCQVKHES